MTNDAGASTGYGRRPRLISSTLSGVNGNAGGEAFFGGGDVDGAGDGGAVLVGDGFFQAGFGFFRIFGGGQVVDFQCAPGTVVGGEFCGGGEEDFLAADFWGGLGGRDLRV